MKNNIEVSIIVPCRNEEKFIGKCLDSLLRQDFSKDKMEILIVDGRSEDRTRKIIKNYITKYPLIKLLDNPNKFTPFGLNIGVKKAKGEIIIRMDAHAIYEKDYVSKCPKYLKEYDVDNVGGVIKTLVKENTLIAKAIAQVLSHPFGAGSSYFRIGSKVPRFVDTVFGGCYKKEIFDKIGLFNENLKRSQDLEFNLRLKRAGGKILLVPEIMAYYYPSSCLGEFFRHNFSDGIWATLPLKFVKMPFSLRHYIPLLFILGLIGSLVLSFFFPFFFWLFLIIVGLYFLASLYFSLKIALEKKDLRYLFLMPITFANRHFAYGLGSAWGIIRLIFYFQ